MQNWMQSLAAHYESMRAKYPQDDLLILFDIDGTILDNRHATLYLLQAYDQHHDTAFFINRNVTDINFTLDELETGLAEFGVDALHFDSIRRWYEKHRWSMSAILESHRPFPGVLDVIRWFQLQPRTQVGLNTARAEGLREETLCSLNKLGREYRVQFSSDLLFMREPDSSENVAEAKIVGIEYFREQGYRPFAMVDNQPQILEAVANRDPDHEILLLHAGTLFQFRPERIPETAVHGNVYNLTELIPKKALPRHIHFVWQGVNNEAVLSEFLKSNIRWADISVLANPYASSRRLSREHNAGIDRQTWLLQQSLQQLKDNNRGVKLDLRSSPECNMHLIAMLQSIGIPADSIWFHADVETLSENEFRHLAETHPGAVIEVAVDFLAPLILNGSPLAENVLDRLSNWGVNRFALSWKTPRVRRLHDRLDYWGFETTIYDVRELETFLQAVLLTPRAICSDFDFPQWQGLHAGKRRVHGVAGEALKLA